MNDRSRTSGELAAAVDSIPVALFATDLDGRVVLWNRQAQALFGWSAEQVVGGAPPVAGTSAAAVTAEACRRALKGEPSARVAMALLHRDGRRIDIEASLGPLRDADGSILGVVAVSLPAAHPGAEDDARYRQLVELSPDMIAVHREIDGERIMVFVNEAGVRLLGAESARQVLGKPLLRFIHPAYRDFVTRRVGELTSGGSSVPLADQTFIRVDGSTVDVEVLAGTTMFEGVPAIQIVVRDRTARVETERALRDTTQMLQALMDSAPVAVVAADLDGKVTVWNRSAEQLYGWGEDEVLGGRIPHLPQEELEAYERDRRRVSAGGTLPLLETRRRRHDGSLVDVQISKAPIRNAGGEISGIMAIAVDITERKRAQAFAEGQTQILEAIASGQPLTGVLDALARLVEAQSPGMLCSVLLVEPETGCLRHGAGPGLPDAYNDAIDGIGIGPSAGSCGSAAFLGEQVIVTDIETDERWDRFRDLAREHGLRACWSTPIFSRDTEILGTFAMYYREPRAPTADDLALISVACQLAGIAVERTRFERQLGRAEARYRALVEQLPAIVYAFDPTAQEWLYVSPQVEAILGARPDDWLAADDPWSSRLYPDDRGDALAKQAACNASGLPVAMEYRLVRDDGQVVWIADHALLVRDAEHRSGIYHGFMLDITARKQAEEALRASEESLARAQQIAHIGSWEWDIAADALTWSDETFRICGLEPRSFKPASADFRALVAPDDLPRLLVAREQALVTGAYSFEGRLVRPDGGERWVRQRARVAYDGDGNPVRMNGTIMDVTEQIRAEHERRRLEAQIQHAQKLESLGVLAGGVAHDFNNLLVGILGNAGLALAELPEPARARRYVLDVEAAALRAAELTSQMLAYAGKGKLVVGAVDLTALVREMAQLLDAAISKRTHLILDLAADLPSVEADGTQLRQVVMNLITNASEALGDREGVVTVSTYAVATADRRPGEEVFGELPGGPAVVLEATDTGVGMDDETKARIFEPFFTTKFAGRGLGLAASVGILRAHGGAVGVTSQPGRGTTMRVFLPASGTAAGMPTAAPEEPPVERGGTVLVVDDEEVVRTVARRTLERFGFAVLTARSGEEALSILEPGGEHVDLVLLDLTMPSMSGEDVLRRARALRPGLAVILTSGYSEEDAARAGGDNAAAFIPKPFKPADLVAVARRTLAARAA